VEHHEGERHGALLEGRVHGRLQLLGVHVFRQRLVREDVPHRPGVVLVHGGGDGHGPVEGVVLADRQRDATLVAVVDRGPRHAGVRRDVDPSVVHVDLPPREPVAVPVAGSEAADLMLGGFEIEPGQEDRRAEHLGEAGRLVFDEHVGIQEAARRVLPLGVEFVLGRAEDETFVEAHLIRAGLLHERFVAAPRAAEGDREQERANERGRGMLLQIRQVVIHGSSPPGCGMDAEASPGSAIRRTRDCMADTFAAAP